MELNQVHRAITAGLAEYVKSSTGYRIEFVYRRGNIPEKVSLTHLAKTFQKQVQIEEVTHKTKTATIAKKDKQIIKGKISIDIHQLGEIHKSRKIQKGVGYIRDRQMIHWNG